MASKMSTYASTEVQTPDTGRPRPLGAILVLVAVLALFAGAAGGGLATLLLVRPAIPIGPGALGPAAGAVTLMEDSTMVEVVKKVSPGVVTILTEMDTPAGLRGATTPTSAAGSGVVVNDQGYIVTNNHVISGAKSITVVFADGTRQEADVVGSDAPFTDIAVVRVNGATANYLPLGDSDALTPGQRVVAIGAALGDFRNTITQGVVSGLHRTWRGEGFVLEDLIQTDAAINHGNSGGPLVNMQGQVVGINTSVIRQTQRGELVEGIGFAIPSNAVRLIAQQIVEKGRVVRPYLGVSHQQINPALASFYGLPVRNGVFILQVSPDSPAARAGVKEGDILIKLGNDPVDEEHPFLNTLMKHEPGKKVALVVNRDGKELALEAVLNERR